MQTPYQLFSTDPAKAPRARPRRPFGARWAALMMAGLTAALVAACGGGDGIEAAPAPTALPVSLAPQVPQAVQQSGSAVAFDAGVADPARTLRYEWQFGDGSSSATASTSHAYEAPGAYSVQLTVTNEVGEVRSAQTTVTVADLALAQGRLCNGGTASGWCWQRPLPQGNTVAEIAITDSGRGWAVGEAGTLLTTADHGTTWAPQRAPTEQDLVKVVAVSAQVAWAAAQNGELLVTSDGGAQWRSVSLGNNETVQSLGASSASTAWVQANSGYRYATTDGGSRWRRSTPPNDVSGNTLSAADGSVWVLPGYAYLNDTTSYGMRWARSTDDGASWVQGNMPPLASGLNRSTASMQVFSASHALLMTNDSGYENSNTTGNYVTRTALWRSVDGGTSWQPVNRAPGDDNYGSTGYQMFSANGLLAQTSNNRVFLSTDAGGSWAAVPLPAEFNGAVALQRAQQLGDARLLLSTFSGRSWYTRNRGTTWAELRAGGGLGLPAMSSVSFFDRREGLVMARDGSSARTTDGGQTWVTSTPNDANGAYGYGWRQARFLPGTDVGWVMSDTSTIFRSTDRGRTWSAPLPQTSAVMVGLSDFHFIDAQRGWAVSNLSYGEQGTIFRSTNGGLSWQAIAGTGGYGNLSAVRFAADGQNGVALGGNGFAFVTSDGGGTWAPRSLGGSVTLRRAVFMNDGTTVFAVGDGGVVMRSPDKGRTWRRMATPTDHNLNDLLFTSSLRGWAVGDQGTLLKTSDGGQSWTAQTTGTRASLQGLQFLDDSTGWVVGNNGTILVTVSGGS